RYIRTVDCVHTNYSILWGKFSGVFECGCSGRALYRPGEFPATPLGIPGASAKHPPGIFSRDKYHRRRGIRARSCLFAQLSTEMRILVPTICLDHPATW